MHPTDPDQLDICRKMVGIWSETVGIGRNFESKKKNNFLLFSTLLRAVGIGQNLWSEMSGALYNISLYHVSTENILAGSAPGGE